MVMNHLNLPLIHSRILQVGNRFFVEYVKPKPFYVRVIYTMKNSSYSSSLLPLFPNRLIKSILFQAINFRRFLRKCYNPNVLSYKIWLNSTFTELFFLESEFSRVDLIRFIRWNFRTTVPVRICIHTYTLQLYENILPASSTYKAKVPSSLLPPVNFTTRKYYTTPSIQHQTVIFMEQIILSIICFHCL